MSRADDIEDAGLRGDHPQEDLEADKIRTLQLAVGRGGDADVDNTAEDPYSQRWFTANGVCTKLRPDMLLAKEKDGEVVCVIVLELSCV